MELLRKKSISMSNAMLVLPLFEMGFVQELSMALDAVFASLGKSVAVVRSALVKLEQVTEEWGCGWAGGYTQKNIVDVLPQIVPEAL